MRSNGNLNDDALHKAPAQVRASESFQLNTRNLIALGDKDLAVTLAFAREQGVSRTGTARVQQLMARIFGVDDGKRR